MKVSVLGLGQFGYAMLHHLDNQNNFELYGYDKDPPDIDFLSTHHHPPRHFQDFPVSSQVKFTSDLKEFLENCDYLVIAIVSSALPSVLEKLKATFLELQTQSPSFHLPIFVSLIKALSPTGSTPTQIIAEHLAPEFTQLQIAALAGGTTAQDLIQGQPLGVTIATNQLSHATQLQSLFHSPTLQVQISTDLQGLQLASSLKNVISIFAGIISGQGYGYGSVTHIISLVATEVEKLALQLGAHPTTFTIGSQCWGNDMFMSATGKTRNRAFGEHLGQNLHTSYHDSLHHFKNNLQQSIEGANTVQTLTHFSSHGLLNPLKFPLLNFIVELSQDSVQTTDLLPLLSRL